MKKLVYASFLTLGLSISAFAVQSVPLNTKGLELDPKYGGSSSCLIDSSTGTAALLCTTGAGVILDVFASSVATTDTLMFRDSATANTTSAPLLILDKNSMDKVDRKYPRFNNGLSVNALIAPGGHAGNTMWPSYTVIYNKDLK